MRQANKIKDTASLIRDILTANNINFSVSYVGINNDEEWPHYQWLFTLTKHKTAGVYFDFKTGLGLVHKPRTAQGRTLAESPTPPTIADLFYSLTLDNYAGGLNFADFCAEYGYSDDSIKAANIFKAIKQNSDKLNSILTLATIEQIAALL